MRLQILVAKKQSYIELNCEILTIILPLFTEERKVRMGKENKPGPFQNLQFLRLFTSYSY